MNDQTGVAKQLSPPNQTCSSVTALAGPWLMFRCFATSDPQMVELYSVRSGRWTTIDYSQNTREVCGPAPPQTDSGCSVTPVDVGARWIEFSISTPYGDCEMGCVSGFGFRNLATGAWRETSSSPPASAPPLYYATLDGLDSRTMLDLDSPSLTQRVCSPVHLPRDGELVVTPQNSVISPVAFYGRFALLGNPYSQVRAAPKLEKCGSRPQSRFLWPESGNSRLIIWRPGQGDQLDGMFLPSQRRFLSTLDGLLPPSQGGFIVGPRHILAVDNSGHVWATPLPRPPK
jgi:hypothetical protein